VTDCRRNSKSGFRRRNASVGAKRVELGEAVRQRRGGKERFDESLEERRVTLLPHGFLLTEHRRSPDARAVHVAPDHSLPVVAAKTRHVA
jgi:hypothetical protein